MMTMVLAIAVTSVMNAQRGMRGQMPDSVWKSRQGDYMMGHRMMPPDSMSMHRGMWQSPMYRYHRDFARGPRMGWGPGPGFGKGFGPGMYGRQGFAPHPYGMGRFESIPNLTEKQKKDISDLRQKHSEEMQKFREESFSKAKELRDAHQKKLMDLLTDEQKKYLEGNTQTPPPVKK